MAEITRASRTVYAPIQEDESHADCEDQQENESHDDGDEQHERGFSRQCAVISGGPRTYRTVTVLLGVALVGVVMLGYSYSQSGAFGPTALQEDTFEHYINAKDEVWDHTEIAHHEDTLKKAFESVKANSKSIDSSKCRFFTWMMTHGFCNTSSIKQTCKPPVHAMKESCSTWFGSMNGTWTPQQIKHAIQHCENEVNNQQNEQPNTYTARNEEEEHLCYRCEPENCDVKVAWKVLKTRIAPPERRLSQVCSKACSSEVVKRCIPFMQTRHNPRLERHHAFHACMGDMGRPSSALSRAGCEAGCMPTYEMANAGNLQAYPYEEEAGVTARQLQQSDFQKCSGGCEKEFIEGCMAWHLESFPPPHAYQMCMQDFSNPWSPVCRGGCKPGCQPTDAMLKSGQQAVPDAPQTSGPCVAACETEFINGCMRHYKTRVQAHEAYVICHAEFSIPSSNVAKAGCTPQCAPTDKMLECGDRLMKDTSFSGTGPADGGPFHCRPILNGRPTGPQIRDRLVLNLWDDARWQKFHDALNKFHEKGHDHSYSNERDYPNNYGAMCSIHHYGHERSQDPQFMTWHRKYLLDLETQLQKISGDCTLTLPFWNSNLDARSMISKSGAWASNRYGGAGSRGAGMLPGANGAEGGKPCTGPRGVHGAFCLTDGIAAFWKMTPENPNAPSDSCERCVWRDPHSMGMKVSAWSHIVEKAQSTPPSSFRAFDQFMEASHGVLHAQTISGLMGLIPSSPADPIFFAHHGMVDRSMYWWQMYWALRGHDSSTCPTCSLQLNFFDQYIPEYMGKYNKEKNCVEIPKSDPQFCVHYTGEVPDPS